MAEEWLRVPIGPHAARWATRTRTRTVLAVVHNVTSATRLLDVVSLLESDLRVQVIFTWVRSSPFTHGVEQFLRDLDVITLPWEQAVRTKFDLAVATNHGGDLHKLPAPLMILSHGMGYNKVLNPESGIRNPESGIRKPETGIRAFS